VETVSAKCGETTNFLTELKIGKRTTVFTDGFKTYDSLVDLGYKKHYRVCHGKNEFSKKEEKGKKKIKNHINGVENFWGLARVRLYKFSTMNKKIFLLHIKKCEFRFNHRQDNLYMLLLEIIRNNPLKIS